MCKAPRMNNPEYFAKRFLPSSARRFIAFAVFFRGVVLHWAGRRVHTCALFPPSDVEKLSSAGPDGHPKENPRHEWRGLVGNLTRQKGVAAP